MVDRIHNQVGAGDDLANLVGIARNAAQWFDLEITCLKGTDGEVAVVILKGADHGLDRAEELLSALGYTNAILAPHRQREGNHIDAWLILLVRDVAESLAG